MKGKERKGERTYVMLIPSKSVMYALAVRKLHEPDSQRTPFAWAMMPMMESTSEYDVIRQTRARKKKEEATYVV